MRKTATKIILIAVFLCGTSWFFFSSFLRPHAVIRDRLQRAKSIGLACKLYAADHEGHYPEHLSQLVPTYIPNSRFLTYKSSDGLRQLDFQYFGGTDSGPPDTVLIRIPPEHREESEIIIRSDMSSSVHRLPTPK